MANTFVSEGKIVTAFKHHTWKKYGSLEVQLNESITSALDVGTDTFTLATHQIRGWVGSRAGPNATEKTRISTPARKHTTIPCISSPPALTLSYFNFRRLQAPRSLLLNTEYSLCMALYLMTSASNTRKSFKRMHKVK